jgi:two-component system cell cycle sensor histidine kinase/response regulator CckA
MPPVPEDDALYRAAFEHARDALLVADDAGRYLEVNPAACSLLGYSRDELLTMSVWDVTPAATVDDGRRLWKSFLAAGTLSGEYVLRRRDGTTVNIEFHALAHVRPGRHLSINRDVSELREASGILREREAWFERVIQNVTDIITVLDQRGTILFESPSIRPTLGYEPEELVGRNAFDLVHPDDLPHVAAAFDLDTQQMVVRTYRFRHKDGSWRLFEATGQAYDAVDGSRAAVIVSRDVTAIHQAQSELHQSQALLQSVVMRAPIIVFALDREGVFTLSEGHGLAAFGLEPGQVVGLSVFDVYRDAPEVIRLVRRALAGEEFHETVDLRDRVLEAWYSPQQDREGLVTGVLGVAIDITERRQLEAQLRQAQKLESVGLLAGGIAHDFNNMLTAITGYAELLLDQLGADDPLRIEVEEIARAAEKAGLLTYQLLAFSRKQVLRPKTLNLNDIVLDVSRMLQRLLGEHISIHTHLAEDLGVTSADPGQLSQVLMNLAVNARDAMPAGGTLTIETTNADLDAAYARTHDIAPGRYVRLAVTDTGTGMTPEVRARIFEPFFTTKGVGRGTGMGLATVYGIVTQSEGYIRVDTRPGHGTAFHVYLPRVAADGASAGSGSDAGYPRGHETVLLVEDEEVVRRLAQRGLESCGYRVLSAPNGEEAVRMFAVHEDIHLVITDVVMPKLSGREMVERLRDRRPNLRVLYMSGYTDDAVVLGGVVNEGTNFIQKPFTMRALAQKVRAMLDAGS